MTCEDKCKSVFNRIYDSLNSGIPWTFVQIKSACPSKKKREAEEESIKFSDEDKIESSIQKSPYLCPDQIHPSVKPCCIIQMQDPCRPCCCETKVQPPPCPPRNRPQESRQPICGCDLCQKDPSNAKCCDRTRAFRDIAIDRDYFEKA